MRMSSVCVDPALPSDALTSFLFFAFAPLPLPVLTSTGLSYFTSDAATVDAIVKCRYR